MTERKHTLPDRTLDRRTYLTATATVGATMLAGCSGGSGEGGNGGGNGDGGNGSGGDEFLSEEPNYDGWFESVDNYEGTLDRRNADSVTIEVGAGDGLSFAPPAMAVSSDTTIVWEWTGEGGQHNVSADGGEFESETTADSGHTFERTLSAGTYKYACTPHEAIGMKGAIVVE
ncbi:halocyanin domain-containing protein [Halopenitus sp. H-Gu1]|uniref:halocyanin domain-containing protein n=1 Tax=Halopenitus sp. H-Gu1 TaxID=3242697 RepID=UPI00359E02AA